MKPNMRYLGGNRYLVRTQAGFKKAIKHYDPDKQYWVSESRGFTYPLEYPSVVFIGYWYSGGDYLYTECTPLKEYKQALFDMLDDLKGE